MLLIAGDIFDTVNPPVKAQERLYDFIVSAREQQPKLTIVDIGKSATTTPARGSNCPLLDASSAHLCPGPGAVASTTASSMPNAC